MHPQNGLGVAYWLAGGTIGAILGDDECFFILDHNGSHRARANTVAHIHAFGLIDLEHLASSDMRDLRAAACSINFRIAAGSREGCEQSHA